MSPEEEERRFQDAKDAFFCGKPNRTQEQWAVLIACATEEAQWLCTTVGPTVTNLKTTLHRIATDATRSNKERGLACLYMERWREACTFGNAYAHGLSVGGSAEIAARGGDRHGMYSYGYDLKHEGMIEEALEWFTRSATLGYYRGKIAYAKLKYSRFNPKRYTYYTQAALLEANQKMYMLYKGGCPEAIRAVYAIGRLLKDRIDAGWCGDMYSRWRDMARYTVLAWMMVARRLGLYRDVAILIGQLVWAGRDTDYGFLEKKQERYKRLKLKK